MPSPNASGADQRRDHPRSYYAATINDRALRPSLDGEVAADVCVIGAGFTGISAALHLVENGYSVVVLEASRIGFGASGRNGGQIVNGYSRPLDAIGRRYGQAAAQALGAMSLEGAGIIRERVSRYGIACDLVDGNVLTAFSPKQMRELEHQQRDWEAHGHDGLRLVGRSELAGIVACDRYVGGLVDRHGGHLHPLNLVLGEAGAVERLGGRIFEQSPVIAVETGGPPVARTPRGSVRSRFLLVCGNAYLGGLVPEIAGDIMPVQSQIIATVPLAPGVAERLLPANHCVEDANFILDYYRRTPDGRLLFGGGVTYGDGGPAGIEETLRPHLTRTFPMLAGVQIEYAWSGTFALTLTRIPHVGRIAPTIYFSHGDSGHGVTTTHLLGRILGEAVAGQAERFDVWSALPCLPFPGGRRFRVPLTALGAWWYSLRDRLGI